MPPEIRREAIEKSKAEGRISWRPLFRLILRQKGGKGVSCGPYIPPLYVEIICESQYDGAAYYCYAESLLGALL
jgi:hypothetical protein